MIEQLPYSTRAEYFGDGIPEDGARVSVIVDGETVFAETFDEWGLAKAALDAFIISQGWMTFEEWHAKYPLRYLVWEDEDRQYGPTFCDRVCTDRLTGMEVFRYDLGDPANWNAEYGGISDDERFQRRKLDRRERIRIEDCVIKD